jgi:hypothetical protein
VNFLRLLEMELAERAHETGDKQKHLMKRVVWYL